MTYDSKLFQLVLLWFDSLDHYWPFYNYWKMMQMLKRARIIYWTSSSSYRCLSCAMIGLCGIQSRGSAPMVIGKMLTAMVRLDQKLIDTYPTHKENLWALVFATFAACRQLVLKATYFTSFSCNTYVNGEKTQVLLKLKIVHSPGY